MAKFTYVEMTCELTPKEKGESVLLGGVSFEPIKNIAPEILYDCYIQSFRTGDARFFALQNEEERRRYYQEELGFPEVLDNPASFAIISNEELVGFTLVLPSSEKNYHISCMCLLPEYRNLGIGKAMLQRIKDIALKKGCRTLTLGTEPEMEAYQLYIHHGFKVIAEHTVNICCLFHSVGLG